MALENNITEEKCAQWEGGVACGGCPKGSDQTRCQRREAGDLRRIFRPEVYLFLNRVEPDFPFSSNQSKRQESFMF